MSGAVENHGYNIGLEMVNCYQVYFDHREAELHGLIDKMKVSNIQIKVISEVMNKLAHGKQKDKKFDISNDETAKKLVYLVHMRNPSVFEDKIKNLPVIEGDLEQKLHEIIGQLREEGLPDGSIHLGSILEKVELDSNIRF